MNLHNVEFLISAAAPKDFPQNRLPEIAFAGKSNVGKSSLINEELDKDDVVDMFKKNRDFEKRVKEISAGVVSELFRILWQRRAFYDDIKR